MPCLVYGVVGLLCSKARSLISWPKEPDVTCQPWAVPSSKSQVVPASVAEAVEGAGS